MDFVTSIHCMDGRIQEPIISFIKNEYHIEYIDTITEPGPCRILSENADDLLTESIHNRISISLNKHSSRMIFISGHDDCAGNPVPEDIQIEQVTKSAERLQQKYPDTQVIKLWIDGNWRVKEL